MTSVDGGLLPSSLQMALHELVDRVNASNGGIRVILFSTSEGVPLGRIYAQKELQVLEEEVLASIESTWAPASKQFPLLGKKNVRTVTAMYETGNLLHVYQTPLVVTILTLPDSNLGAVRSTCLPLLKELLEPLCHTLLNSLTPNPMYVNSAR